MIGLFLFFNIPHIVDLFKNDFVDTDLVYDHPLSHVVFMLVTIYHCYSSFMCGGKRVAVLDVASILVSLEFYLCIIKSICKVTLLCFVNSVKRKIVGFVF